MPTKFKQMKICKILISASALIILLSGCKEGLNKSSAVGVYNFENTNRIEGNEITTKRYLVISEGEKGEYKYSIINTIIVNKKEIEELDPHKKFSLGILEENKELSKWLLKGGEFGDKGGFIIIPDDKWNDFSPREITIAFLKSEYDPITFTR